jgi:nitrogen fixation NifU-like protein
MDQELLDELYESFVLENSRKPKNFGRLNCNCFSQKGKNPSCGDNLELFLLIENNIVKDVKFEGEGCALSISSASLMTQAIKEKSIIEIKHLLSQFVSFINENGELEEIYEPLHIYKNVNKYPLRVKCVLLPWRTLEKIILEKIVKD